MNAHRMAASAASAVMLFASVAHAAAPPSSCADLVKLEIAHVVILEAVESGRIQFVSKPIPNGEPHIVDRAAMCRVRGVATPVPGSRIGFELQMPLARAWNHRIRMFGNGGYSSAIPGDRLHDAVNAGYAALGTDTGHDGDDPEFAVGRPESIDDWGHRAVHESIVAAKALVAAYYGEPAQWSYFDGCSTGGHQALMEAQRYPADFNGIVAGAPGNNRTRLNIGFLWQFVSNHRLDGTLVITPEKLRVLTERVLATCGSVEERRRGYLDDPFSCRFDPTTMQCVAGGTAPCLSSEEVEAARRMYVGARNPRTGEQLYPPWLPGSEIYAAPGEQFSSWSLYWADPLRPAQPARTNFWRFWAFGSARWDWWHFDFDRDVARLALLARRIDATDPDLAPFRAAGGKLIQYHGLIDPVVSPWDSRDYYDRVVARAGHGVAAFYRLYFLAGMAHCGGGPGLAPTNLNEAIEGWVERGVAPAGLGMRSATGEEGRVREYRGGD